MTTAHTDTRSPGRAALRWTLLIVVGLIGAPVILAMVPLAIVAVALAVPVVLTAGPFVAVMWLIVRATADEPDNRRCRRAREVDEARTIQAIYQGLERMEHRIESLETIVIDKAKTEKADEYAY